MERRTFVKLIGGVIASFTVSDYSALVWSQEDERLVPAEGLRIVKWESVDLGLMPDRDAYVERTTAFLNRAPIGRPNCKRIVGEIHVDRFLGENERPDMSEVMIRSKLKAIDRCLQSQAKFEQEVTKRYRAGQLMHPRKWPFGTPDCHHEGCGLFEGKTECSCVASEPEDEEGNEGDEGGEGGEGGKVEGRGGGGQG